MLRQQAGSDCYGRGRSETRYRVLKAQCKRHQGQLRQARQTRDAHGTVNGSNVTFTLLVTPVTGTEEVFLNGLMQGAGKITRSQPTRLRLSRHQKPGHDSRQLHCTVMDYGTYTGQYRATARWWCSRADLNTTTAGECGHYEDHSRHGSDHSSSGVDSGTGDVTINAPASTVLDALSTTQGGRFSTGGLRPGSDSRTRNGRLSAANRRRGG